MALPPGPRGPLWTTFRWVRDPYPFLDECRQRYGETFTLPIAWFARLVVFSNPDHVREIFSDDGEDLEAGRVNRTLSPLLGERSVLMADGRPHRRKRKLLLPPFHGERMQAYGRAMLDVTDAAIERFPDSPFSLHPHMQDITLRVIVRTVFGFEEGPRLEEMVLRTKRILELGTWPGLLFRPMQLDLGRLTPYGRFRRAVRSSDEMLYEEIARRRAGTARGADILSLLVDARDEEGRAMSDEELRDELVTLLVAGHETTATALTWAMRWLLDTPRALADVKAELAALGPDAAPAAIARSEQLDAVAREALRLVPVIPLVARALRTPQTIGGWDLPEDTVVACSIYLAHRRKEAYPNPTSFDPSRFLGKKASAYEFFPFGGGVRRCIGMAFALYEMKMVLARLLGRTELRLAERAPPKMTRRSITITPAGGLMVTARPLARAA
jgi:cytochrome P450